MLAKNRVRSRIFSTQRDEENLWFATRLKTSQNFQYCCIDSTTQDRSIDIVLQLKQKPH